MNHPAQTIVYVCLVWTNENLLTDIQYIHDYYPIETPVANVRDVGFWLKIMQRHYKSRQGRRTEEPLKEQTERLTP